MKKYALLVLQVANHTKSERKGELLLSKQKEGINGSVQTWVICGDMQLLHVVCDGGMPPHFFAQGARINDSVYIDYCIYNSSTRSSGWPDKHLHDADLSHKARVAQSSWLRVFMDVSFLTCDIQTLRINSTISRTLSWKSPWWTIRKRTFWSG